MTKKIGIIDYGMGNLHSVVGALNYLGLESFVSSDRSELEKSDALILPGVGAFPDAMDNLAAKGLVGFIRSQAESKPLLGICLGMQLLFDRGYEFRECDGLGLIGGRVIKLSAYLDSAEYKIPHMGWNKLTIVNDSPLMKGLPDPAYVYFVHSFKAEVGSREDLTASTDYGEEIAAVVGYKNVFGTQFHPGKKVRKPG